MLDVARRIAGTASLGLERYVALTSGGPIEGTALIDVKAVVRPESVIAGTNAGAWRDEASRVVAVQTLAQAVAPADLAAHRLAGASYVVRELQPTDDRVDLGRLRDAEELRMLARDLGCLAAWAHLRGAGRAGADPVEVVMAFGRRRGWRSALMRFALSACRANQALHRDLPPSSRSCCSRADDGRIKFTGQARFEPALTTIGRQMR